MPSQLNTDQSPRQVLNEARGYTSLKRTFHDEEELQPPLPKKRKISWTTDLPFRPEHSIPQLSSAARSMTPVTPAFGNAIPSTHPNLPKPGHLERPLIQALHAMQLTLTPPQSPLTPIPRSKLEEETNTPPPSCSPPERNPNSHALLVTVACLQCALQRLPCSKTHPVCARCARRLRSAAWPTYPPSMLSPSLSPSPFSTAPCLARRCLLRREGGGSGVMLRRFEDMAEEEWSGRLVLAREMTSEIEDARRDGEGWNWAPRGATHGWMNWKSGKWLRSVDGGIGSL